MRATRAYIAGAGTAVVMLGASLAMLVLVSSFVAFGSWPGSDSGTDVNQVVLTDVVAKNQTKAVAVASDAVARAKRADRREQVAVAKARTRARANGRNTAPTGGRTAAGSVPAGTPVAQAPTGATTPQAPSTLNVTSAPQQTAQAIDNTTRQVTTQVQQGVQNTATQVGEVVDQVIGGAQTQTDNTVTQVQNAAGGLLGH